ncbi:SDR family NAD(P)-dependent oxidoreductase [Sphingopyxis terrae]|uniref:Short-chain dehydrogenase n=1 Tax=Sphingopyxis terrae subsp. ummariensis TaxID=429001 RepID=A0A1Y6FP38_9SPHN|nr:SDR family NAD(P)-dependent oxidoreductase [Sphingopyxis terrae]PCF91324.1 oxidoreductase [Sphingopyxis terrae subsp. ummariensis]SMQ76497.1 Short-chain dehydrogenase [Sphingopyxis terrae subsp. ummariensis]
MSRAATSLEGLVVATGASSGIGLELARRAAADGCALILVADTDLAEAVRAVDDAGAPQVETVLADLASDIGRDTLLECLGEREITALFANAGHGGGGTFLEQPWAEARHIVDTNIIGTMAVVQHVARRMQARGAGRILITGSIAGELPGSFQLVYNASKAFLNDFAAGLRNELKDTGVVVSCLVPGPTDTRFFERADMEDTPVGRGRKADPATVAQDGYSALLADDGRVVSGLMNKVQSAFSGVLPDALIAEIHRHLAQPDGKTEPA